MIHLLDQAIGYGFDLLAVIGQAGVFVSFHVALQYSITVGGEIQEITG